MMDNTFYEIFLKIIIFLLLKYQFLTRSTEASLIYNEYKKLS